MHSQKWLSRKEVRARYQTSDSSLGRWINAGAFPAPQTIGTKSHRWHSAALDEYDKDPAAWKAHSGRAGNLEPEQHD